MPRDFVRTAQAALLILAIALSSWVLAGSGPVGVALVAAPAQLDRADQGATQLPSLPPSPEPSLSPSATTAPEAATPAATAPAAAEPAQPAAKPGVGAGARSQPAPVPGAKPPAARVVGPPSTGGKPGPSNTGVPVGTTLTPSGDVRITTPNEVVDGLDISGSVSVAAPGVVIKNSRIHGSATYGILVSSGSVTIADTELYGSENAIAGDGWVAIRVNIHGVSEDGVKLGDNVTLQDSWIHDVTPSSGAHSDGGQMQSGVRNLVVKHNVIDMSSAPSANSALFLAPDLGPSSSGPVTIDGNWLDGGNYTLFCVDGNNGQYLVQNISITNNRFGRAGGYGPSRINVAVVQSGNVWSDTGVSLTL